MRRQGQQARLLVGEDLGHRAVALLGMRALVRVRVAPVAKLRIKIVDIPKRPCGEEGIAEIENLPLDFALLVPASGRAGAGGEVVVPRELEQPRMKADRGALPFQDRRL
jgi:hypothetical protein